MYKYVVQLRLSFLSLHMYRAILLFSIERYSSDFIWHLCHSAEWSEMHQHTKVMCVCVIKTYVSLAIGDSLLLSVLLPFVVSIGGSLWWLDRYTRRR